MAKKSSKKVSYSKITILLTVGALCIGLWLLINSQNQLTTPQTSNEISTGDRNTYTNNTYGFSFRYPPELSMKDNTGDGGDSDKVPWKASLSGSSSTFSFSVQKRQCYRSTGLPESEIMIDNQSGVRFLQEDQFDGILFSIDKVEFPLKGNLCLTLEKYVSGKDASLDQNNNVLILNELTAQDKDLFEEIISSVKFTE